MGERKEGGRALQHLVGLGGNLMCPGSCLAGLAVLVDSVQYGDRCESANSLTARQNLTLHLASLHCFMKCEVRSSSVSFK